MKVIDIFKENAKHTEKPLVSFEIFPPKKGVTIENVGELLTELKKLDPGFVSVTCSAGGSGNKNGTVDLAGMIKNDFGIESVAHLTCIASTRGHIEEQLDKIKSANIENVLALRGDIPKEGFDPSKAEYKYAKELIKDIKAYSDLGISAAAYPEGHIDCEDFDLSVEYMKQKEDAGADVFVSQLFFENSYFYNMMDKAIQKGIKAPVSAGIMPMMSKNQILNMILMCGASLPSKLIKLLSKYADNEEDLLKAGLDYAGGQIEQLKNDNVDGIHIYTMNKPNVAKYLKQFA